MSNATQGLGPLTDLTPFLACKMKDRKIKMLEEQNKAQAERIEKLEKAIWQCLVVWGKDPSQEKEWLELALAPVAEKKDE